MTDLLDPSEQAARSLLTPHEQRKTKILGQTSGINPFSPPSAVVLRF